jgi:hypothetical protein
VSLGFDGPPNSRLEFVAQSKDGAAADQVRTLIAEGLDSLSQQIRKNPQELKPLVPRLEQLKAALTPAVVSDRVSLSLDGTNRAVTDSLAAFASQIGEITDRQQCTNNLREIAIGMHYYHDAHHTFPAVANFDQQGKPLLSWRVHLLPFLNQEALYKEFHLDEPWDSDHNKKLIPRMPKVFQCPPGRTALEGKATCLVPVGAAFMFTGGPAGIKITEVTDGTSNTILLVNVDEEHAVVWTRPSDWNYDPQHPTAGLRSHGGRGFTVAFADASVRLLPVTTDKKVLHALLTRNGGEVIPAQ